MILKCFSIMLVEKTWSLAWLSAGCVVWCVLLPCPAIFSSDWCSWGCLCLWWPIFQVPVNPRLQLLLLVLQSGPWFQSNRWSLCVPGGHSVVALQYQGLFESAPMEIACLGLFLLRLLFWAYSGRGSWFWPAQGDIASSGLLPLRLLTHAQSDIGLWFGVVSSIVAPCTCSCGGCCLGPAQAEVAGSDLFP